VSRCAEGRPGSRLPEESVPGSGRFSGRERGLSFWGGPAPRGRGGESHPGRGRVSEVTRGEDFHLAEGVASRGGVASGVVAPWGGCISVKSHLGCTCIWGSWSFLGRGASPEGVSQVGSGCIWDPRLCPLFLTCGLLTLAAPHSALQQLNPLQGVSASQPLPAMLHSCPSGHQLLCSHQRSISLAPCRATAPDLDQYPGGLAPVEQTKGPCPLPPLYCPGSLCVGEHLGHPSSACTRSLGLFFWVLFWAVLGFELRTLCLLSECLQPFYFFLDTGSYHVAQAGFKILGLRGLQP
jgi:hypothetical protein